MNTYNIEEDNEFHLSRFINELPNASYISGFLDGDGCIFIREIKDGYQCGISFSQSRLNILKIICYHFGGKITTTINRNNKTDNILKNGLIDHNNVRNQFELHIRSHEFDRIINYVRDKLVIKCQQLDILNRMKYLINKVGIREKKKSIYNMFHTSQPRYSFENINIPYIAGLFDADACFYLGKDVKDCKISISQKKHPAILNEIKSYIGFGTIHDYTYIIYGREQILSVINAILPYLIVKYNQCKYIESYLTTPFETQRNEIYKKCNYEKHAVEKFNYHELCKRSFDEYNETKKNMSFVLKQIHKRRIYQTKSTNMSGLKNHNYGKKFSKETRDKMSSSIRKAKSGLDDDKIKNIRILLQNNSIVHVSKITGFSKFIVSGIKNNDIVCYGEEKRKQKLSQKEINRKKRKISIDEMYEVLDMTYKSFTPSTIYSKLSEIRKNKNIENNLSIDIIKNIRKNLKKGKLPFEKDEVDEKTYQKYFDMFNQI
jgi:hypothetical protein